MFAVFFLLLIVGILIIFGWQVPEPGTMRKARSNASLASGSPLEIPRTIREDALAMARIMYKKNASKQLRLASDMIATYRELRDTDILLLFNSGGYGWSSLDKASGYATIISAIESQLKERDFAVCVLNYQRADRNLRGYVSEILNASAKSTAKPRELALRLDFLWRYLPNLKIILASESNGTVMSNQVMRLLPGESRLFSIELGPPFWYKSFLNDRVLNLRSNGKVPDAFSYGHWRRAIKANIDALRGKSPQAPGNVLLYVGAPGHDYNWTDYPVIREKVAEFLFSKICHC